jgi:hypothetical protein
MLTVEASEVRGKDVGQTSSFFIGWKGTDPPTYDDNPTHAMAGVTVSADNSIMFVALKGRFYNPFD